MTARVVAALAAVAAACAGCGAGAGLHIENGGRTVRLHQVAPPSPPPTTHAHRPPSPGVHLGGPAVIAYDSGTLWCAVQPGAGLLGSLIAVDTTTGRRVGGAGAAASGRAGPTCSRSGPTACGLRRACGCGASTRRPARRRSLHRLAGPATAILDTGGSVWATVQAPGGGRLVRLDPASGSATAQAPLGPSPSALTVAGGSAWVTDSADQSIERFTVSRNALRPAATITLPRSSVRAPTQITVFGGFVWVYERGRVLRIGESSDRVLGTTRVAAVPGGTIAAGSGGIWVITRSRVHDRGAVRLLDASDGLPAGHRIVVGGRPTALATDGRSAWVLDSAADRLIRVFPD